MKSADKMLINVIGDVMVAAGAVSYLGAFTVSNYTCMYYYTCKCMYVYTCKCMYIYTCKCMYIHTYMLHSCLIHENGSSLIRQYCVRLKCPE